MRAQGAPTPPSPAPARAGAVLALVTGVVVGVTGTLAHRWEPPLGLLLAVAIAVAGGVFARALASGTGVLLHGLAAVVTVQVLTFVRPGGDILVTAEALSVAWLLGLPLMTVAAAVTPRAWYADSPGPRYGEGGLGE